jgi:hypothetical protein
VWSIGHLIEPLHREESGHERARGTESVRVLLGYAFSEMRSARHSLVYQPPPPSDEWTRLSDGGSLPAPPTVADAIVLDASDAGSDEGLGQVLGELARLQVKSSAAKKGPEGVVERAGKAAPATHEQPRAQLMDGAVMQPSPYGGIACRGCHLPISVRANALSCADGLVHPAPMCIKAAREQMSAEARQSSHRTFYGVRVGRKPGIYLSWPDCEAQVLGFSGASYKGFDGLLEARLWVAKQPQRQDPQVNVARPSASFDTMSGEVAASVPGGSAPGSIQRRGLTEEKIGAARLEMMTRCIDGQCGHCEGDAIGRGTCEKATRCRGACGRSLHLLSCAQVGKGYAALGKFTCHHCIGAAVLESGVLTEAQVKVNKVTMFFEMTQGAEATAGSYAEYARLEEQYASGAGMLVSGGRLAMPHSSDLAFKNFLSWFVTDAERALSLKGLLISAASYCVKVGVPDRTKDKGVKAHVKQLESNHGLESELSTTATPMMMGAMVVGDSNVITRRFERTRAHRDLLISRWKVHVLLEGVGGC